LETLLQEQFIHNNLKIQQSFPDPVLRTESQHDSFSEHLLLVFLQSLRYGNSPFSLHGCSDWRPISIANGHC
jgi:hypothetical protein